MLGSDALGEIVFGRVLWMVIKTTATWSDYWGIIECFHAPHQFLRDKDVKGVLGTEFDVIIVTLQVCSN